MADTSDLRNGLIIRFKNELYTVVEFLHVKPGKGGAFVRTTLKNIKTGKVLENTFRSGESLDVVRVERRKYQYLYRDGDFLVCMDNESYDQINISSSFLGDTIDFLKEGFELEVMLDKETIITVEMPMFVNLEVTETEPGLRGDTATNVLKPAKLETGASVNVPLFINAGDILKIDTRTGEYMERVKS
ncbi:MAG: elongation factor P [Ignavibacteriaceae bacterium]|nr:elongation factor P [Ignavibacteriaceae bacterium]